MMETNKITPKNITPLFMAIIVFLFFTACNLNKNKVDEEKQIISYEVDSIHDIVFFPNDSVKPLPYFSILHSNHKYSLQLEHDYHDDIIKKYAKKAKYNANRKKRGLVDNEMFKRIKLCLDFASEKYSKDTLQRIECFVGDFPLIAYDFSSIVEKMKYDPAFAEEDWDYIYNKALNNTFLREEFNLVLKKYKREVDTITIGPDPFPIEYPIQVYLDKYKIDRPDSLLSRVIEVNMTIYIKKRKPIRYWD